MKNNFTLFKQASPQPTLKDILPFLPLQFPPIIFPPYPFPLPLPLSLSPFLFIKKLAPDFRYNTMSKCIT